jgi:carbamoylphosphate synthase large subunit
MILVISSKKTYSAKRLQEQAGVMKQELRVMSVLELASENFKPNFNFGVLYIRDPYINGSPKYLAKLVKFAKTSLKFGVKVVDANITKGKIGLGKWYDYKILKNENISIPKTEIFNQKLIKKTVYPFILKWVYGMGGKNTYLVNSEYEYKKVISKHPKSEWIHQEYIDADFEYKVICVGYKVLPYVLKIKFNKKTGRPDFNSVSCLSLEGEGRVRGNNKLKKLIEVAERASKVLGRELSKVDILEKDGKFYVLEVNRFPGLEGFEKLSKRNVYGKFVEYLVK